MAPSSTSASVITFMDEVVIVFISLFIFVYRLVTVVVLLMFTNSIHYSNDCALGKLHDPLMISCFG